MATNMYTMHREREREKETVGTQSTGASSMVSKERQEGEMQHFRSCVLSIVSTITKNQ